jgi:hypothetical protein
VDVDGGVVDVVGGVVCGGGVWDDVVGAPAGGCIAIQATTPNTITTTVAMTPQRVFEPSIVYEQLNYLNIIHNYI